MLRKNSALCQKKFSFPQNFLSNFIHCLTIVNFHFSELGDDKCLMSELPLTADNGNLRCDKTVETSHYASSCQGDIQCPPNFISTGLVFQCVSGHMFNPHQTGGWHKVPQNFHLSLILRAVLDPNGNQTIFSCALLDADFGPMSTFQ